MNELENPILPETDTVSELKGQVARLWHVLVTSLALLIVMSGTLNVYFRREQANVSGELKQMEEFIANNSARDKGAPGETKSARQRARASIESYANRDAAIKEFARKLTAYGVTHKDFDPIATKYGLKPTPGAVTTPSPAPAANPPRK
jgi:hypothetical protein